MVGLRSVLLSKKKYLYQSRRHRGSVYGLVSSVIFVKIVWILIFLEACNAIHLSTDVISKPNMSGSMTGLSESMISETKSSSEIKDDYDFYRIRRQPHVPPTHSQYTFNDFTRALGRLHFGPLLRLRSVSNRAGKSASHPPKEKRALSYLSRFYPMFQSSSIIAPEPLQSLKSARRKLMASFSGEASTFPSGRLQRPIMRLRWGK